MIQTGPGARPPEKGICLKEHFEVDVLCQPDTSDSPIDVLCMCFLRLFAAKSTSPGKSLAKLINMW